jgi:hypothetical protein
MDGLGHCHDIFVERLWGEARVGMTDRTMGCKRSIRREFTLVQPLLPRGPYRARA